MEGVSGVLAQQTAECCSLSVEGLYGPGDRYCAAGPGWLRVWLGGMFVREICPGMYGESSEPILSILYFNPPVRENGTQFVQQPNSKCF